MEEVINEITVDQVRKQLGNILSCEAIKNSQVISRFLEFVVEEKLSGRDAEIKEYTIGVKALGRPVDFNPQLDAIVRIHAGRLRRMLNEYYQGKGVNDSIIIGIPKGTYIPTFEHHSAGSTKEFLPSSDTNLPDRSLSGIPENDPEIKPVLAVFPFHNLSTTPEMNYFVEGIGEQLSIDLTRFQHISVIAYYSTWKYSEEAKDFMELSRLTGANYVLTGSVRFMNDHVRFNVGLASAKSGIMIWTETYSRSLTVTNVYDVQDEIVDQILTAIADDHGIMTKLQSTHVPQLKRAKSQSVYEAVSLYYTYQKEYKADAYQKALIALKHAAVLEPENPLVLAMLSKMNLDMYAMYTASSKDLLKAGMKYAQQAVQLDTHCQQAWQSLAWAYLLSGKTGECYESIERCISLNRKAATITGNLGFGLICLGDYARGFDLISKSMHLNPTLPWCSKLGLSLYYYHNQKFDDSYKWASRITSPDTPIISLIRDASRRKANRLNPRHALSNPNREIELDIPENTPGIIGRLILDTKMQTQLMDDLSYARVAVK